MTTKEYEKFIKFLKRNNVTEFNDGNLIIKIAGSPSSAVATDSSMEMHETMMDEHMPTDQGELSDLIKKSLEDETPEFDSRNPDHLEILMGHSWNEEEEMTNGSL